MTFVQFYLCYAFTLPWCSNGGSPAQVNTNHWGHGTNHIVAALAVFMVCTWLLINDKCAYGQCIVQVFDITGGGASYIWLCSCYCNWWSARIKQSQYTVFPGGAGKHGVEVDERDYGTCAYNGNTGKQTLVTGHIAYRGPPPLHYQPLSLVSGPRVYIWLPDTAFLSSSHKGFPWRPQWGLVLLTLIHAEYSLSGRQL